MNRKEQIEGLVKRYLELEKRLYIGHDIQIDVYDEMKAVLGQIQEVSKDRIEFILSVFDTLPKGEWCQPDKCRTISNSIFQAMAWIREKKTKYINAVWLTKWIVGFHFCVGEDDGYPEIATWEFHVEWLSEEDEAEVRYEIISKAEVFSTSIFRGLSDRASEAKKVSDKIFHIWEEERERLNG